MHAGAKSARMLIGAHWCEAGRTKAVVNPYTGEEIAQIPLGDANTVAEAIKVANEAFAVTRAQSQCVRVRLIDDGRRVVACEQRLHAAQHCRLRAFDVHLYEVHAFPAHVGQQIVDAHCRNRNGWVFEIRIPHQAIRPALQELEHPGRSLTAARVSSSSAKPLRLIDADSKVALRGEASTARTA